MKTWEIDDTPSGVRPLTDQTLLIVYKLNLATTKQKALSYEVKSTKNVNGCVQNNYKFVD